MKKKPKLLFLSPVIPKGDKGVRKRCLMHIHVLSKLFDVDMVIINKSTYLDLLAWIPGKEEIGLIKTIKIYVAHVAAYLRWRRSNRINNVFLRTLVKCANYPNNAMPFDKNEISDLKAIIGGKQYDVVFAFRLSTALCVKNLSRVASGIRNAKKIVDFDDIESITKSREADISRGKQGRLNTWLRKLEASKLRKIEKEQANYFDKVLVCSSEDKDVLDNLLGAGNIAIVPNAVQAVIPCDYPPSSEIIKILFVGTMDHGPNVDGIKYFIEDILPLLREKIERAFQVDIVGRYPSAEILAFGKLKDVNVYPDVPDVAPYYMQASLVIAPIRFGGGTRIKILESFAFGRPVVSTTIGAEGIEAIDGRHIMIGDTPEEFANACKDILTDKRKAHDLSKEGNELFLQNYSFEAAERIMDKNISISQIV